MENPMSWNAIVKTINEAIIEHRRAVEAKRCGLSLQMTIFNKLNEKGFLKTGCRDGLCHKCKDVIFTLVAKTCPKCKTEKTNSVFKCCAICAIESNKCSFCNSLLR